MDYAPSVYTDINVQNGVLATGGVGATPIVPYRNKTAGSQGIAARTARPRSARSPTARAIRSRSSSARVAMSDSSASSSRASILSSGDRDRQASGPTPATASGDGPTRAVRLGPPASPTTRACPRTRACPGPRPRRRLETRPGRTKSLTRSIRAVSMRSSATARSGSSRRPSTWLPSARS